MISKEILKGIFKENYWDYIDTKLKAQILEPIQYTIESGENRFRSGLTFLIGDKMKCEYTIQLGAVAEIIWASILVLDDLGDNATRRRGKPAVWVRNGILHAAHLLTLGQYICEDILKNELPEQHIIDHFHIALKDTVDSQIEQVYFNFTTLTENDIRDNYIKKTSIGRWALSSSAYKDPSISQQIFNICRDLSFAAQIKDDVEDFIKHDAYESKFEDIKNRIITYPIYLLFTCAEKSEQELIVKYFTGQVQEYEDILKLMSDYNIIEKSISFANSEIDRVQESAQRNLGGIIDEFVEWVGSHRIKKEYINEVNNNE